MNTEAERRMPPEPRAIVALFRAKGHSVAVRLNRNGSLRYSVDGGLEMNALQMSRRYDLLARVNKLTAAEQLGNLRRALDSDEWPR